MSVAQCSSLRTNISAPFKKPVSALGKVHSFADGLLPAVEGNRRNVEKLNDVVAVFQEYERRLRAVNLPGLSNRQRDLVRGIVKSADKALSVLENGDGGDVSKALDRAYVNGAEIEEHLDELAHSPNSAPSSQVARAGSSAAHSEQQSLKPNEEHYRGAHFVTPIPDNFLADFDSQEENGNYCAREGNLKSALMNSTSSSNVIAARGGARSAIVHGVSGMAGVGKTTALIALGHDGHVRDHFHYGVLRMALGADASVMQITDNLADMMKFTGARESAVAVQNETDVRKAVHGVARWFQGRCNLFLIDDVWPTSSCSQGYLPVLREILTGSTHSRIVLTTQNRDIVPSVGSYVVELEKSAHAGKTVAGLERGRPGEFIYITKDRCLMRDGEGWSLGNG